MEALKKKFKSRRGASILLALLFLLVCMMVGASVMMAAASNVGKTQSNKEEQQKYLTLSSAMTMLIDELKSVEYVGNYSYEKRAVCVDADGDIIKVEDDGEITKIGDGESPPEFETTPEGSTVAYYVHHYTQEEGTLSSDGNWLNTVLPLEDYLDDIFANNFSVPAEEQIDGDKYDYTSLSSSTTPAPANGDILEFTVNDSGYGDLSEDKVQIKVTLRTDGSILLVADLWEKGEDASGNDTWSPAEYTMEALLRPDPDDSPEKLLVLPGSPEEGENTTESIITWKLEYVFKKEADPSA